MHTVTVSHGDTITFHFSVEFEAQKGARISDVQFFWRLQDEQERVWLEKRPAPKALRVSENLLQFDLTATEDEIAGLPTGRYEHFMTAGYLSVPEAQWQTGRVVVEGERLR